jgi:DNA polymerase-3 subunit epsilon
MFDLETTGLFETDRIVQIGMTKHYPDKDPIEWKTYVNPEIPIPAEATAVNHITDEMVKDAPKFKEFSEQLVRTALTNSDFGGHNVLYDLKMLRAECRRAGETWDWEKTNSKVIDTKRIQQLLIPNNLGALYKEATGEELKDAHDAAIDVMATETVLEWQLRMNPGVPRTIIELDAFCWPKAKDSVDKAGKFTWKNGMACIGFGKFKGTPLHQCEVGYLEWIIRSDFPEESKEYVRRAIGGEVIKP